ncbi:MAG: tetraacyldisaccharide 4'-kinase [Chitinophagaceae bacterium]
MEVLLVTGIANPRPLKEWAEHNTKAYHFLHYPDHFIFTVDHLKEIKNRFKAIQEFNKITLTTEKDAVRLIKFGAEIRDWPLYVMPVHHYFLFDEGNEFDEKVIAFVKKEASSRSRMSGVVS